MNVLITGGSGFLGSHIADRLTAAGHDVVIFDLQPSPYLAPGQTMVCGSVLDRSALVAAMADRQVVYHLAAIADIDEAMRTPHETVEVNVMGTVNLLEAARAVRIERFVFASSIYVYSNQGSFYRTTKQAAEHLIFDYQERFGLDYTILRFGSLFGPRAGRTNAIHAMLTQALAERRINYGGTGKEVREYIHVQDAAAMSADILAPEYRNEIIHLTGRERMTTGEMLVMIGEIMGGAIELKFAGGQPTGHYIQTPYNFVPRIGRKMTRATYIDLGLGLLDCLHDIYRALNSDAPPNPSSPGDGARDAALR